MLVTVNHSKNFVGPLTASHSNTIESYWRHIKARLSEYNRRKHYFAGYFAKYIFIRNAKSIGIYLSRRAIKKLKKYCEKCLLLVHTLTSYPLSEIWYTAQSVLLRAIRYESTELHGILALTVPASCFFALEYSLCCGKKPDMPETLVVRTKMTWTPTKFSNTTTK